MYEGGFFKCHLIFPKEYPLMPPKLKVITDIWLPVHTVETILVSVISMLADPNDESPANVDAAKEWRDNFPEFKKKVSKCVRKSQEDLL